MKKRRRFRPRIATPPEVLRALRELGAFRSLMHLAIDEKMTGGGILVGVLMARDYGFVAKTLRKCAHMWRKKENTP